MQIEDSFRIQAPVEEVWAFLLDIEKMSRCVPGVDSVEEIGENTYAGALKVKVGPISASFNGRVTLTEIEPPNRLVAEVSGDDKSSATAVKAAFEAELAAVEDGTEVSYRMDVNLRGRMAQFGSAVVNATARKTTAEFAENLREQIER